VAATDGPANLLSNSSVVTKLPAQDLERARSFYRDALGLEPVEERDGGLRYVCASGEFHVFASSGAPSGTATQMGFDVADLDATVAELRARGVSFESVPGSSHLAQPDGIVEVDGNYPSKGTGERGAFFRDSEGNVIGLGQATRRS
jgi:catechol 2,3-dioxygenase-like lactoylglutathione lyase family enzyme